MQLNEFTEVKEGNSSYYSYKEGDFEIVIEETILGFAVGLYEYDELVFPKIISKKLNYILHEATNFKSFIAKSVEISKPKKVEKVFYTKTKLGDKEVYEHKNNDWIIKIEENYENIFGGWNLTIGKVDKKNSNIIYPYITINDIKKDKAKEYGVKLIKLYT